MGEAKRRKQLDKGFGKTPKAKITIEITHQLISPEQANILTLAPVIQKCIKECEFPIKLISFAFVGFAQEKKGTVCMLFSNGDIPSSKVCFLGSSPFQRKLAPRLNRHYEQIINAWVDELKKHPHFADDIENGDGFYSMRFPDHSIKIAA